MLDRLHPTNKHDVELARVRRSTTIIVYLIGAVIVLLPLFLNPG